MMNEEGMTLSYLNMMTDKNQQNKKKSFPCTTSGACVIYIKLQHLFSINIGKYGFLNIKKRNVNHG